jgi:hypothetical protein
MHDPFPTRPVLARTRDVNGDTLTLRRWGRGYYVIFRVGHSVAIVKGRAAADAVLYRLEYDPTYDHKAG